jgi:outer membrane protein OmpA-like peptidoglycan-associated protein
MVFASGRYAPGSHDGRKLIAHELAHVVQQGGGAKPTVRREGDPSKAPAVLPCQQANSDPPPTNDLLLFANMVSALGDDQKSDVAGFAARWKDAGQGASIRLDGYASTPGEESLNWQLSCDRAVSVKNELVTPSKGGDGVTESAITFFMHGKTDAFGEEAQNRRVMVAISPGAGTQPKDTPDQPKDETPADPDGPKDGGADTPPDASCAKNPNCPDDYCKPFPTKTEATADRDSRAEGVLGDIGIANSRAVPLFRKFVFDPGPAGDISGEFAKDFTQHQITIKTNRLLVEKLKAAVQARPPDFQGQPSVTKNITDVMPATEINTFVESVMVFDNPSTIPGLFAGGVGKTQVSCKVGQNTAGAVDDSRSASGTVTISKNSDGTFAVSENLSYTVVDTIDFCPGNCGGWPGTRDTVPLSRWEASGVSGDVPFTVKFGQPIGSEGSEE